MKNVSPEQVGTVLAKVVNYNNEKKGHHLHGASGGEVKCATNGKLPFNATHPKPRGRGSN
jgi:hypothetical protein